MYCCRVSTLLRMAATDANNGIASSGHRYAMSSAAAAVNPGSALSELYSGMEHVNLLSQLSGQDGTELLHRFRRLAALLLNKDRMKIALNTGAGTQEALIKGTETFLSNISGTCADMVETDQEGFKVESRKVHHVVPFPINFTAQAIPTVPYTHPDSAPLRYGT